MARGRRRTPAAGSGGGELSGQDDDGSTVAVTGSGLASERPACRHANEEVWLAAEALSRQRSGSCGRSGLPLQVASLGGAVGGRTHRRLCTGGWGDTVLAAVASAPSGLPPLPLLLELAAGSAGRADLWAVA